ncbi:hypothetical protein AVEN_249523-1, partial [Araneus ventricosus]
RSEYSQEHQILFASSSSYSAPATTSQDQEGHSNMHKPLPPRTAADHIISKTEFCQRH